MSKDVNGTGIFQTSEIKLTRRAKLNCTFSKSKTINETKKKTTFVVVYILYFD